MQISRINSQFLAHLQVERSLSENTLAAYRRDLNYYEEYLTQAGIFEIAQVDASRVAGFVDYLHAPVQTRMNPGKTNLADGSEKNRTR
ncbi:site-specific integrase [Arcanobacterium hippocoleae]|uniref:site-specific integrase n=1 Tax=Arcanobacterium hippocoleae TaxID=149017 RepID=UPI00333E7359